ncbi:hypothetical protein [Streptomyces europaeiscabiei]|uniref:hypothetical protein n=1 Tax=Streptomyces europaeiscabiei TaxID=146819 RepID=UPI0029B42D96|nr:hypothetical protein [Streptomyces europaeiscabiei]MDX3615971.1 hypothetical protein [Streptomyces europaeiscabiei]
MVKDLNYRGMRFIDMQIKSDEARSAAWWNQIANGVIVNPPPRDLFPKFAQMMGVTERRVAEMAAEEWYGVTPRDGVSSRVQGLADAIDSLSDEDAAMVEAFIHRLRKGPVKKPKIVVRREPEEN